MPERLYQLRFGDDLKPTTPEDVTPPGFKGPHFEKGYPPGRFIREVSQPYQIRCPQDAAKYLMEKIYTPFEDFQLQEELWVLLLDTKYKVTHEVMVYRGTINTTLVRGAEVLREAVRLGAAAIVLGHSHPSGNAEPSPEDNLA